MSISLSLTPVNDFRSLSEIEVQNYPFLIGRGPACDYQILHPMMSRRHFQILRRGYELWIQDLESKHGTQVNGVRISARQRLRDGDIITLPCGELEVHLVAVMV